jgi:hypothetical protein
MSIAGHATMFEHACKLGLEGIVSKHRDRHYKAGRCAHWIKIKNPASPAMMRASDGPWQATQAPRWVMHSPMVTLCQP